MEKPRSTIWGEDENGNTTVLRVDEPLGIQGKRCDACGHTEKNGAWPNPDVCPRCWPEFQAGDVRPRRRRMAIPPLPTKDRLTLQVFLQLASELIIRFHPSEQVGWLNYLLEQLDVQNLAKYKRLTHAENTLRALRREISDRLESGTW